MNGIYRVIFNHATQTWTAVSELAKGRKKTKSEKVSTLAVAVSLALGTTGVYAATVVQDGIATRTEDNKGRVILTDTHAGGDQSVQVGSRINMNDSNQSIAIGNDISINGRGAIAIGGDDANSAGRLGVVAGQNFLTVARESGGFTNAGFRTAQVTGNGTIGIGTFVVANGTGATAVGLGATASVEGATSFGTLAFSTGTGSSAFGLASRAEGSNTLALGAGARATLAGSIALGAGSVTTNGVAVTSSGQKYNIGGTEYDPLTNTNYDVSNVVSVGNATVKRQIQNVAPGQITETSTDAINGSQLYAITKGVQQIINNNYQTIQNNINNSGFNLKDNSGTVVTPINKADAVTFKNGTFTTSSVSANGDVAYNVVTQNINVANGVPTETGTAGLATAQTVATAIKNSGFNLQANGQNGSLIKAGDTVSINKGDNTEVVKTGNTITVHANKTEVTATASDIKLDPKVTGRTTAYNIALSDAVKQDIAKGVQALTAVEGRVFSFDGDNSTTTGEVSAGNITFAGGENINTVASEENGIPTVTINLNSDITVDNVTVGSVKISKDDGINAGDKTITGVANAVNANDAVNLSQLNATKVSVVGGANITSVDSKVTDSGTTYTINAKDTSASVSNATGSPVSVTKGTEKDGVTDYVVDLTAEAKTSLEKANTAVQSVTGKDGIVATTENNAVTVGLTPESKASLQKADSAIQEIKTTVNGQAVKTLNQADNTQDFKNGTNIDITTEDGKIIVATKPNVAFTSVNTNTLDAKIGTITDLTSVKMTTGSITATTASVDNLVADNANVGILLTRDSATIGGLLTANGGLAVASNQRIDMGDNQVHNVKAGTADTDAVNVSQLKANTTTVAAGKNITSVNEVRDANGIHYTIDAKDTTVSNAQGSPVSVTKGTEQDGVTDYVVDLTAEAKTSLEKANTAVQNVTGKDGITAEKQGDTVTVGLTPESQASLQKADSAIQEIKTTVNGQAVKTLTKDDNIQDFENGKNIDITTKDGKIIVATKDSVTFTDVNTNTLTATTGTIGTLTSTTINNAGAINTQTLATTGTATIGGMLNANGGLTVANGQTVQMGNNRVQGVANAVESTDAVNLSQLNATKVSVVGGANITSVDTKVTDNGTTYTINAKDTSATVSSANEKALKVTQGTPNNGITDFALELGDDTKASLAKADTAVQNVTGKDGITAEKQGDTVTVGLTPESQASLKLADSSVQSIVNKVNGQAVNTLTKNANEQDFVNGDNIEISNDNGAIKVATAKTVAFDKVTVGTTSIDKDAGINAGNKTIKGVANATANDEAVNLAQLKAQSVTVKAGQNVNSVNEVKTDDGITYTIDAKDTTVSKGSDAVTVEKGTETNGVTDYKVDLSADTKASLAKADTAVQNVQGQGGITATKGADNVVTVDLDEATKANLTKADTALQEIETQIDGKKVKTVKKDDNKANFITGDNIELTDENGAIKVATKKDVTFTNVNTDTLTATTGTIGTLTSTSINNAGAINTQTLATSGTATIGGMLNANGGLTVANGQTVNMGNNRIQGVANAVESTDAVNLSQLNATKVSVVGGANITSVDSKVTDNGTTYTINAKDTSATVSSANEKALKVTQGTETNGITNFEVALGDDTKASLAKADTAVQDVKGQGGITATKGADNVVTVDLDEATKANLTKADSAIQEIKTTVNGQAVKTLTKDNNTQDFVNGDNIEISNDNGAIKVATAKTVAFDKVTVGTASIDKDAGINAGNKTIQGVANATKDDEAVNLSQLNATKNAINTEIAKGLNFSADSGNVVNRQLGDTLAIVGGNGQGDYSTTNVRTVTTAAGVRIELADNPTFKNVKASDVQTATLSTTGDATIGGNMATTGTATIGGMLNANGGLTVANGQTVNMGNNRVQGVADGTADKDAVNVSQLRNNVTTLNNNIDAAKTELTAKGLDFSGNTGETHRDLGTKLAITGTASTAGNYSGANLKTVVTETGVALQFADNPEFKDIKATSIKTGDNVLNGTGLTIGTASITNADGINAGNKTIKGVANATANDEAVNLAQLKAQSVTVKAGQNVNSVNEVKTADGITYTIDAKDTTVSKGSDAVTVEKGTETNGVTDYKVDLSADTKVSLAKADSAVQEIETQIDGKTVKTVKKDDNTVNFITGDNIELTDENGAIKVATKKDVTFDKVNSTVIEAIDARINNVQADDIVTLDLTSTHANINTLESHQIRAGDIKASTGTITDLTSNHITANRIDARSIDVISLTAKDTKTDTLATTGNAQIGGKLTVQNGIDATNNRIENVANATRNSDAVNLAQLKANTTTVVAGANITSVDKVADENGVTYTINAKDTSATVSSANEKALKVTQGTPNNGITDFALELGDDTKASLAKADSSVQSIVNKVNGKAVNTLTKNANEQDFVNGDNIEITNDNGAIKVATKQNVSFTDVKTGTLSTTGTATIGGMLNANGGLTVANGQTVNMGDNRVQGVADGTADKDAVNVSQLRNNVTTLNNNIDAAKTELTAKGLGFSGNTGETHRNLGTKLAITGAGTTAGAYSGANLKTVVTDKGVELQFAENPEFKAVTATDVTTTNLTATNGTIGTLGTTTINNAGAINTATLATTGDATIGGNLATKGTATFGGKVTANGGVDLANNKIENVADGTADKDAVNLSQLNATKNAINTEIAKGLNFSADSGNVVNRQLGDTFAIVGGKGQGNYSTTNVRTVTTADGVRIELADDPTFKAVQAESVTAKKVNAESVESKKLSADEAEIVDLNVTNVTAKAVKTEQLSAKNATIDALTAQRIQTNTLTTTGNVNIGGNLFTTGSATIGGMLNANGGLTVANGQVVNMGGNRVQGVEDGIADSDAVNLGQLKAVSQNLTDKGFSVSADSGEVVSRKLGDTVAITAGNGTGEYSTENVRTVTTTNGVEIQLADNPTFNAVNATSVTAERMDTDALNAKNITADQISTNNVSAKTVETETLNAQRVDTKELSAGNVTAQAVKTEQLSAKTAEVETLTANSVNTDTLTASGMISANGGLTVAAGQTVNMGNNRIQGVANGVENSDAVNVAQLNNATTILNQAINAAGWTLKANGDSGEKIANNGEVNVKQGKNIQVNREGSTLTIQTVDNPNFTTVTANNVETKDLNATGNITLGGENGQVSVANGTKVDLGNNVINGVADGDISPNSKQAVNGGQVAKLISGEATLSTPDVALSNGKTITQIVAIDSDGKAYTLTTYNAQGRGEVLNNSVISAIHNMNEQGIKFFHTNDGTVQSEAQKTNSVDSQANGAYSTAVGYQASAEGTGALAIGQGAEVKGEGSVSIGAENSVNADNSGAVGRRNRINGIGSYVTGSNNRVDTQDTYVFGSGVTQTVANSVFLGNNSGYVEESKTTKGNQANEAQQIAGQTYYFAGGKAEEVVGVVSVGNVDERGVQQTRRIQNVAPGLISAESTDAVNGSQLHSVVSNLNQNLNAGYNALNRRIHTVDRHLRSGVAGAVATASLVQAYNPSDSLLAVGGGTYRGASALALGYSKVSDNGKVIFKLTGSVNNAGHYTGGASIGYRF